MLRIKRVRDLVLSVVLFSGALDGMEKDSIAKHDPYSIFDLLHNNGCYLKELIEADSSINYCHDFAIAQKTLMLFLDEKEPKRDKFLDRIHVDWKDEIDLINRFGKEVIALAHTVVKQEEIRKFLFSALCTKKFAGQNLDEAFKKLIKKYPAVINARNYSHNSYGGTLAHYLAAQRDCSFSFSTLKFILEQGANPHMRDKYKRTPLFYAIKEGSVDSVALLLTHNASVNIQDHDGNTPLHYVMMRQKNRRKIILELLSHGLSHGVDSNVTNKWGDTPLHCALNIGTNSKVVQCLLFLSKLDFFKCNILGESYVDIAIKLNCRDYLTLLLFKVFYIFSYASYGGEEARCRDIARLIIAGADVNARENNICINVNTYNQYHFQERTVLCYILAHNKCEKCLRLLIERNVDVNASPCMSMDWSYIDVATHNNFYNAVAILVSAGACINLRDQNNSTALFYAAFRGDDKIVKVLLDCGAFVDLKTFNTIKKMGNKRKGIFELLKNADDKQECCVCYESQYALNCLLSYIPCKNNHRSNCICKNCYESLKCVNGKKQCPFNCKDGLKDFDDYQ